MLDPSKRYRTRRGDAVVELKHRPRTLALFGEKGDPTPWRATLLHTSGCRFVQHYTDLGTWTVNPAIPSELDLVESR